MILRDCICQKTTATIFGKTTYFPRVKFQLELLIAQVPSIVQSPGPTIIKKGVVY